MADIERPPPLPPRPGRAVRTSAALPLHGPGPGVTQHHPTRKLEPLNTSHHHHLHQRSPHRTMSQVHDKESHVSRIVLPVRPNNVNSSHLNYNISSSSPRSSPLSRHVISAHRPQTSSPAPTHRQSSTLTSMSSSSPSDFRHNALTLDQLQIARREREPAQNEYIHTSTVPKLSGKREKSIHSVQAGHGGRLSGRGVRSRSSEEKKGKRVETQNLLTPPRSLSPQTTVTTQPKSKHSGSNRDNDVCEDTVVSNSDRDSVICQRCGGCRCHACNEHKELPQRWLCDNTCLCSAERVVNICSCLYCAKFLFYNCARDSCGDGRLKDDDYEHPCTCSGSSCCLRYSLLLPLSLLLPCLCCYWPLKGATAAVSAAYSKYHRRHACTCTENTPQPKMSTPSTVMHGQLEHPLVPSTNKLHQHRQHHNSTNNNAR